MIYFYYFSSIIYYNFKVSNNTNYSSQCHRANTLRLFIVLYCIVLEVFANTTDDDNVKKIKTGLVRLCFLLAKHGKSSI